MSDNDITSRFHTDKELFALGRQLTIEYYDCAPGALLDPVEVEADFLKAADESHATVITSSFHNFEPQGVSGVVIIAESHFTVHAWPEHNYAAVDIFTCGDSIDIKRAVDSLTLSLGSTHVVVSSDRNRGLIPYGSRKKTVDEMIDTPGLYPISWKREVEQKSPWGVLTSVDLYGCDPDLLEDQTRITRFVHEMCNLMEAERSDDDCPITFFGKGTDAPGFTMTLPRSTALVSGIVSRASSAAYIDLFSCNFYEPRQVAEAALDWFKASNYKLHLALRQ